MTTERLYGRCPGHAPDLPSGTWWTRVAMTGGCGLLLATNEGPLAWQRYAQALFGEDRELAHYLDAQRGIFRMAAFVDGRLDGCLFIAPAHAAPQWDAIAELLASDALGVQERRALLSGRSADAFADSGPVVCACFGVGLATIRAAIASRAASSVAEIGTALRAGTNCGSCLPELKRILADECLAATG